MISEIKILFLLSLLLVCWGCSGQVGSGRLSKYASGQTYNRVEISGIPSTGPLQIDRVELAFQNGLGEIVLAEGEDIKPVAKIKFRGNGVLRGRWVIDDRQFDTVSIVLSGGDTLSLSPAKGLKPPSFVPGPHTVFLDIRTPAIKFTPPGITYFISGRRTKNK